MLLSWSTVKYDAGFTAVDNNACSNAQMCLIRADNTDVESKQVD